MSNTKPSMPDPSVLRDHFSVFVHEEAAWVEAKLGHNLKKGLSNFLESRNGVEFHVLSKGR